MERLSHRAVRQRLSTCLELRRKERIDDGSVGAVLKRREDEARLFERQRSLAQPQSCFLQRPLHALRAPAGSSAVSVSAVSVPGLSLARCLGSSKHTLSRGASPLASSLPRLL